MRIGVRRWVARCLAAGFLPLLLAAPVTRAQAPAEPPVLKVCQDPNNLPYSNEQGQGFENRLAELLAQNLGARLEYVNFPQRLGFVRNTLRYRLPGQVYRCDVIMSVPVGFEQTAVTKPYFRSTYGLVFPAGKGLDTVQSAGDFLALGPERLGRLRIGLFDATPASRWLDKHGLVAQGVPYRLMSPDPQDYPGKIIENELREGRIDVAIVWGPLAGFYLRRLPELKLRWVPLPSEPGVRFDYAFGMGLRQGEPQWKERLERFIDTQGPQIRSVLQDFGVPLMEN